MDANRSVSPATPARALGKAGDAAMRESLRPIFAEMDVDCDGRVAKLDFARYLTVHPLDWPLAAVLKSIQDPAVRDQFVAAWFRRIDVASEGSFNFDELCAFFHAMQTSTQYKEALLAEVLFSVFDVNFDERLDRVEFQRMLTAVIGEEPTAAALRRCGPSGISRPELVALLHEFGGDLGQLSRRNEAGGLLWAIGAAVAMAAGAVFFVRYTRQKHHH